MKYEVKGKDLKLVSSQNNAAVNGWIMHLTPDGKRLMILGGGGWRPKGEGAGGGYVVAVYNADDLESMVGQAPHGINIAFHPVLIDDKVAGAVALADIIRPEAREALGRLKGMGIRAMMLTGDAAPVARWVAQELKLDEYFAGDRRTFDVPVDLSLTTGFTRAVLAATARIPFGSTSTYGAIAEAAGSPRASRAAGVIGDRSAPLADAGRLISV